MRRAPGSPRTGRVASPSRCVTGTGCAATRGAVTWHDLHGTQVEVERRVRHPTESRDETLAGAMSADDEEAGPGGDAAQGVADGLEPGHDAHGDVGVVAAQSCRRLGQVALDVGGPPS